MEVKNDGSNVLASGGRLPEAMTTNPQRKRRGLKWFNRD
jgi:hypothetical protein